MGDIESKRKFITELFFYYKPLLSKERQEELLLDWSVSCIESEEYEMADTIKKLLIKVRCGELGNDNNSIDVSPINNDVELVFIEGDHLPRIHPKNEDITTEPIENTKIGWGFVNRWSESFGYTPIEIKLSIKNRTILIVFMNYGISYGDIN